MKPDKSKEKISEMFNSIANHYDFVGHLLSLGIDKKWRKSLVNTLEINEDSKILDIASGTGDLAIALAKKNPKSVNAIDISEGMLAVAQRKTEKLKLTDKINYLLADAQSIPFPDDYFDVVTIGFGVRNFFNYKNALCEINRVMKNGGQLRILELTLPQSVFGKFYYFYLFKILPFIADKIAHAHLYKYLPESIHDFDQGDVFMKELSKSGFGNGNCRTFSFGIASLYAVEKCPVMANVSELVKDLKLNKQVYNNAV